jgi:uncharacterized membrane protein YeaQ/YmgE (transglycosylase-associated protein family)
MDRNHIIVIAIVVIGALVLASLLLPVITGLLIPLLVWGIIGWLAGRVMRGRGYGIVVNVLLGIVGGIVGSLVFNALGLGWVGGIWLIGNIVVGVVGAIVVLGIAQVFAPKTTTA